MQNDDQGIISNDSVSAENSFDVHKELISMTPEEIKFCETSVTSLNMMKKMKIFYCCS